MRNKSCILGRNWSYIPSWFLAPVVRVFQHFDRTGKILSCAKGWKLKNHPLRETPAADHLLTAGQRLSPRFPLTTARRLPARCPNTDRRARYWPLWARCIVPDGYVLLPRQAGGGIRESVYLFSVRSLHIAFKIVAVVRRVSCSAFHSQAQKQHSYHIPQNTHNLSIL